MTQIDEQKSETTAASSGKGTILFGGSGFLGPHILENYPEMISVGRTTPPTSNRHIQVDSLNNLDALRDVAFDKVIYIIGNTEQQKLEKEIIPPGEPTAFDYHVAPLIQTLEQLKGRPIKKFVHFSTILIYDEKHLTLPVSENAPIDPYQSRYIMSKYLAEEICRFYTKWIPIINIRLSDIYGPTPLQRVDLIHRLIRQLLEQGKAQVWTTKPERDFIYIEDAAHAVVKLLDTDYTGNINLGSGTETSIRKIVDILQEISGCSIEDLGNSVSGPMKFRCDMTTIKSLIDWQPRYSLEEGLRRTYEKMKSWRKANEVGN